MSQKITAMEIAAPAALADDLLPAVRASTRHNVRVTVQDLVEYDVAHFGANKYGIVDSTIPFQNAIAAIKADPTRLGRLKVRAGTYVVKNLDFIEDTPGTDMAAKSIQGLQGAGIQQTIFKAPASGVSASDYLMKVEAPALGGITSLGSGCEFSGFTLEGQSRGVEHHGMLLSGSHVQLHHVHFRSLNGCGLKMGATLVARECQLDSLIFRHCGRHSGAGGSTDEPCLGYPISTNIEGHNLITHANIQIVYPWYAALQIRGDTNFVARKLFFTNLICHGFESLTPPQQGRLSANAAMIDIDGECDNLLFNRTFLNHPGSDDAQTGLGTPNWLIRVRNSFSGFAVDNLDFDGIVVGNSNRGGLIKIEAMRYGAFRNIQIDGTPSNECPAGHLYAPAGTFSGLRIGHNNMTPSLMTVAYADSPNITADGEWKDSTPVLGDTDALDTVLPTQIFSGISLGVKILSISYTPKTAITGDASDYFSLIFKARSPSLNIEIGRIESTASMSALEPVEMTLTNPAQLRLAAGETVTVEGAKAGAGALIAEGSVTIRVNLHVSCEA